MPASDWLQREPGEACGCNITQEYEQVEGAQGDKTLLHSTTPIRKTAVKGVFLILYITKKKHIRDLQISGSIGGMQSTSTLSTQTPEGQELLYLDIFIKSNKSK